MGGTAPPNMADRHPLWSCETERSTRFCPCHGLIPSLLVTVNLESPPSLHIPNDMCMGEQVASRGATGGAKFSSSEGGRSLLG